MLVHQPSGGSFLASCVTAAIRGADPETTREVGPVRGPRCRQNADWKDSLANNDRVQSPLQRRYTGILFWEAWQ